MDISLTKLGAYAGSITAILALLWYIGEPALERYVDNHIQTYDERVEEEESNKVGLRHLLGDKMQVADDEVHIELGHLYKKEVSLYKKIDSLQDVLRDLRTTVNSNYTEIEYNYSDIKKLKKSDDAIRKQLDKHGLFR